MFCPSCSTFDIHALYALAAKLAATSPPVLAPFGTFPEYHAFPWFHAHQPGIAALRLSAANGCQLCGFLWQSWVQDIGGLEVVEREWLANGQGGEQIYLGLSKWAPKVQGMPYLTVLRKLANGLENSLGMFEVVADRDKVTAGYGLLAREVSPSAGSDGCLAVAREWLESCLSTHKTCGSSFQKDRPLPTRAIDVGLSQAPQEPRLVITNGSLGSWAALSYCWGGDSSFALTAATLKNFLAGIPLETFPATLRDAVLVTRSLKLRYLWIDALCILQDSAEDWGAEAARMGDVYRGSTVTISATNSPSASHGIFNKRDTSWLSCRLDWKSPGSDEIIPVFLHSGSRLWDASMKSSPLNTRGWTLQETLLSSRTLSYGAQQMAWECQQRQVDEGGRPFVPGDKYREKQFMQQIFNAKTKDPKQSIRRLVSLSAPAIFGKLSTEYYAAYDRWFEIIQQYTSRNLTVATDILPALSGLAGAFQRLLGDEYHAGLWKGDILRGITWRRTQRRPSTSSSMTDQSPPADYHVPSWSWASVKGRMTSFQFPSAAAGWKILEQAKVLHISTTPRLMEPFGQTSGGSLILKAPFHSLVDPRDPNWEKSVHNDSPILQKHVHGFAVIQDFEGEFSQQHKEHAGQRFGIVRLVRYLDARHGEGWVAELFGAHFLLVESTGEGSDEYRRVALYTEQAFAPKPNAPVDETRLFFAEMDRAKWEVRKIKLV